MTVKRAFDLLFAFAGLMALFPFFLLISIIIKITMPGPIFFSQIRIGQHGKPFRIYKFRSMHVSHSGNHITVKGEQRITRFGKFLRKYKLDEIPELWNILIGNMSFVGPRPDVPGYADKLHGEDRLILQLKPGITGPASLKYSNEEELLSSVDNPHEYNDEIIFPDKVKINLEYYRNHSLLRDIKIIINTLARVY